MVITDVAYTRRVSDPCLEASTNSVAAPKLRAQVIDGCSRASFTRATIIELNVG